MFQMVFSAKAGLRIASQYELGFVRACIRYASLFQPYFVCGEENQRKGKICVMIWNWFFFFFNLQFILGKLKIVQVP